MSIHAAVAAVLLLGGAAPALALSDALSRYETGSEEEPSVPRIPLPDPMTLPDGDTQPVDEQEPSGNVTRPDTSLGKELPEVIYDLDRLPEPVRRMRQLIIEACRSGDVERLRPLLGSGAQATQLSFGGPVDDPVAYLRDVSGDEPGHEILAILLEVMEAGFVHLNPGTDEELYVWPYFFAIPIEELTDKQRVELFTLVTAGDYEDMKNFGAYIFYRSAITPDGQWRFFVAGD
ncbi:cytoplasmic protein [Nitratireductor luteus]|uniref:cytoplasmic protein n=1 Tax=Nitratireductor luteus TaxID=2976980 RepID=UPI002240AB10|nr:cytoplasmic protein [Nitratireductor luteus]